MPQLDITLFSGHLLTLYLTLVSFYYLSYQFLWPGLFKVVFLQMNLFGIPAFLVAKPKEPKARLSQPARLLRFPRPLVVSPETVLLCTLGFRPRSFGCALYPGLFLHLRLSALSRIFASRLVLLGVLRSYQLRCLRSYLVLLGFRCESSRLLSELSEAQGVSSS